MRPDELQGDARRRFFTWRGLGLSEAAAMQQLEYDGAVTSTATDADMEEAVARAFGRAPDHVREAAAPGQMTKAEAEDVLLARTFGRSTSWGAPVTPTRIAEAEQLAPAGDDIAKQGGSPLVAAVDRAADQLLRENRGKGRDNALQEAWAAQFRELVAKRADDQALRSLDEAMRKAYPKLRRPTANGGV